MLALRFFTLLILMDAFGMYITLFFFAFLHATESVCSNTISVLFWFMVLAQRSDRFSVSLCGMPPDTKIEHRGISKDIGGPSRESPVS